MEILFSETLTGIAAVQTDAVTWLMWMIGIGLFITGAAFIRSLIMGGSNDA